MQLLACSIALRVSFQATYVRWVSLHQISRCIPYRKAFDVVQLMYLFKSWELDVYPAAAFVDATFT